MIRAADPLRDAQACARIYAPSVHPGTASFEERPPDAAEMARRMAGARAWLVAEEAAEVVGFAYAGRHRERAAYRWAVETSVYVRAECHGRGVGRAVYAALLDELGERRYRMACAAITLPNPASVALHEALGFAAVGVFRRIGFKAGAWRDVGWWQRPLGAGDDGDAPAGEPIA